MILRRTETGWEGTEARRYKDEPGSWLSVSRRNLFDGELSQFQVRYFEIAAGGYSSFEKHMHEHCVVVLRGCGEVRLGETRTPVGREDVVSVGPGVPHQFVNTGDEPFGFLCVVDRERDRPVLLGNAVGAEASE